MGLVRVAGVDLARLSLFVFPAEVDDAVRFDEVNPRVPCLREIDGFNVLDTFEGAIDGYDDIGVMGVGLGAMAC